MNSPTVLGSFFALTLGMMIYMTAFLCLANVYPDAVASAIAASVTVAVTFLGVEWLLTRGFSERRDLLVAAFAAYVLEFVILYQSATSPFVGGGWEACFVSPIAAGIITLGLARLMVGQSFTILELREFRLSAPPPQPAPRRAERRAR
jgi:hypothetical protein